MCYRSKLVQIILVSAGFGFLLSCIFHSRFLLVLLGCLCIICGLFLGRRR